MSNRSIPPLDSLLEHRNWVRAVARRLLRDEHAAEDLAQEAWARALRSPPDPDRDPRPWLRRVLKNLASNRYRGEGRRHRHETVWRDGRVQRTPAELVAEAEQHRRLVGLVLDLEEPFKTALVLRFYDGLGPKEIAERLGIPVGTVHSRIARAVERLKQQLDGEERGDRTAWIAALVPLAGFERLAPAAAATAATTTSITGILLMTLTKSKLALLAFLLLGCLAGGALYLATDTPGAARQAPRGMDVADDRAPALEGRSAALRASPRSAPEAEADTAGAAPRVLHGRVVDVRGAPVPRAEVFVLPRGAVGASEEELQDPRTGHLWADADGRFAIRVSDAGAVRVVAYAAGRLPASVEPPIAGDAPIELVVGDPWQLTVHVSDAEGRWPRGCVLWVASDFDATFERAADPAVQAFEFDTVPWEPPAEPRVVIPVSTRARLRIQVSPPERMAAVPAVQYVEYPQPEIRVRLIPSGSLRLGLVGGNTAAALAVGTRVELLIREESTGEIAHSLSTLDSNFDLDAGFAPGRYVIEVGVEGYRAWTQTVEFSDVGERVEVVARLEPNTSLDALGEVVLQITAPIQAPEALRTLLKSGAPPGFVDEYRVLIRQTGSDAWIDAWAEDLGGGRVALRTQTTQPGLRPGTWDFFIARRDTGTAAFVKAVRIFGDQENVVDVTLEPGTAFRLPEVASKDARFTDLKVRTQAAGDLPLILWTKDGSNSITAESGITWLLRLPRKPVVLGPFPGPEVEVRLTGEDGNERSIRVRGAGVLDRPLARK